MKFVMGKPPIITLETAFEAFSLFTEAAAVVLSNNKLEGKRLE
ncbi:hypothetical protein [Bacillus sp. B1-b2]|nr:hypothetical protein [Bacillus sp. B1-b2]